jgi:hypothetical protein
MVAAAVHAAAPAAAAPTAEEVGDADSFGHDVIYLGSALTGSVQLLSDCTPDPSNPPPPNSRCIVTNAQPAQTSWNEDGLATLQLPARSTKSLICFALTPNVSYEFHNLTGTPQPNASFLALAVITIENSVLNDPRLIDPSTSLPYGGKMTVRLATYSESRSIAVGEREQQRMSLSRHCIAGLVSKSSLVTSGGLSATQADEFFLKPMKFTFGSVGSVQMVVDANYFYGIRLYGDR